MRYTQENARILAITESVPGVWNVILLAPAIAGAAVPGQFVTVRCDGYELRRPISICGFDSDLGVLRLVFEVRGKGTEWMARRQSGEVLDLVGPLGHGFPLFDQDIKAVLIGGGIGTPPLLPLALHYGKNTAVITGFRTETSAILQEDFAAAGAQTLLCTDDGSAGFHGFTTQALAQHLEHNQCDIIYTCGPKIMMKRVADTAAAVGVPCYVSMEERMACGVGACLGCTCKTRDEKGDPRMTRVCLNGPVFEASEVDWS